MIFRFRSGSSTPLRRARNRSPALTRTKRMGIPAKAASTSSPSFFRIRPVSTKMAVSRSPTARESRAAQTEESTPPERASSTCLSPIFSRRAATAVLA